MSQPENIEAIEKRLRTAADTLRTNSNHASNKYFLPAFRCEPGADVVVRVGIQPGELPAPPSVA